ncbi:16035_t:CDS:2, partial [Racocetra fulgida]
LKDDLGVVVEFQKVKEYADLIYKHDDLTDVVDDNEANKAVDDNEANKAVDDDIESSIAKELAQMKRPHTSRRFASIQTGTDCVDRMELIKQIASVVGDYHVVNLDKPDLTLKKYNVESIFEEQNKEKNENNTQEHKDIEQQIGKEVQQLDDCIQKDIPKDIRGELDQENKVYNMKVKLKEKKWKTFEYITDITSDENKNEILYYLTLNSG